MPGAIVIRVVKQLTGDPKNVSIQNESELTSGTPSILLGYSHEK